MKKLYSVFAHILLFISAFSRFPKPVNSIASAILASRTIDTIIVDKFATSSHEGFPTIQDAIDSVPSGNKDWVRIKVQPGTYQGKVTIPKDKEYIILEGSGCSNTIITFYEHDQTDSSATFTSWPNNFFAKDITFKNSYKPEMAVAARIYGDKSSFLRCGFIGFKDTLWDVQGRHYYKSCYIEGAVDFIWGGGQSFFESCLINVTAGMLAAPAKAGYITAQNRQSSNDKSGFVFRNCIVKGNGQVYLGRAYGPYSRVLFWHTFLDVVVVPAGWDAWLYGGHEDNFMYAEVDCKGLSADTSGRVSWLRGKINDADLKEYTKGRFIDHDLWLSRLPYQ